MWDVSSGGAPPEFRRPVTITLLNSQLRPARRLRYVECWPSKFKAGADLKGGTSENHIEELHLQHEGFVVVTLPAT